MSVELLAVVAATLLGLVHIGAASFTFKAQVGNAYTVGFRDASLEATGMAGRMQRAQRNFMETYPFFAILAVMVEVTDSGGAASYWGVLLYLAGRVAFLPLYAWGRPGWRTAAWKVASVGLILVGIELFV